MSSKAQLLCGVWDIRSGIDLDGLDSTTSLLRVNFTGGSLILGYVGKREMGYMLMLVDGAVFSAAAVLLALGWWWCCCCCL